MATALAVSAGAQHQFEALHALSAGGGVSALGDVDGDGDLDVIVATWGQNRLFLNDGMGRFVDATTGRLPVNLKNTPSVALGDVDGDGDLDIVFGGGGNGYFGERTQLLLNDGTGHFTDATVTHMPVDSDPTADVVLGDVDGDGDLDLVCANNVFEDWDSGGFVGALWVWHTTSGAHNTLYLNDGAGHFTDATARIPWDNDPTTAAAMADVDGDGDLDIVFANGHTVSQHYNLSGSGLAWSGSQSASNRLYLNDGTGTFTNAGSAQWPNGADSAASVAFGDVDGDGDADLLVGNDDVPFSSSTSWPWPSLSPAGQPNRLYLNDGGGVFQDVTTTHLPFDLDVTRAVAFADVDGDGDLDIVCGTGDPTLQNRIYLNDGTGIFVDATAARLPPGGGISIAIGDVDSDGDLDLAIGGETQTRLYSNLLQQLDATQPPQVGQIYSLDAFARCGTQAVFDVAVVFLSTTRVSIPIPPFGLLGIEPTAMLPTVVIPQPAGVGSIAWNVPNVPNAVGTAIYSQALVVSWPFGARFTNVVADVVQ